MDTSYGPKMTRKETIAAERNRKNMKRKRAEAVMPEGFHKQRTIQVNVDVDEGVAELVLYLNTIPGIRTHASCQGTIGEGGPHPYRPQVMVSWADAGTFQWLRREFDLSEVHTATQWCYVHPRVTLPTPASV